jgi:signal transduction histidine kinase
VALLAACFVLAVGTGWTVIAGRIDHYAYDLIFRWNPAAVAPAQSAVLEIDEATFGRFQGVRRLRTILTEALRALAPAQPAAVAIDVVLADPQEDAEDDALARAMAATPALALACEQINGRWEDPLARFQPHAKALGHVHPEENQADGVSRRIPLELAAGPQRRWAMALEAFRLAQPGAPQVLESPGDLQIGARQVPVARQAGGRPMWIRYRPGGIPSASLDAVLRDPRKLHLFRGKAVFVGVTAMSGRRDQVVSPLGEYVPGVVIHAHAFETLAQGDFLTDAGNLTVLAVCLATVALAGAIFWWLSSWHAYVAAAALLLSAHVVPVLFFRQGVVFPYFALFASAWLAVVSAAAYQYFVVRRQLLRTQTEKEHYQRAIHFVAHEMRSPLATIQGSSEIMGRYSLNEEKRKQMAATIHSESRRLAKLIQTFLDVERLSEGEMEMKRETFSMADVVEVCRDRALPLAERKSIRLTVEPPLEGTLEGDRELMEYAVYNLLTNAVKYSPGDTEVRVRCRFAGDRLRLAVRDEGLGMDEAELKNIFRKFYRTKSAEKSGEAGTGIGLSIVEQIVTHHGGKMEVSSTPGVGSCFTMVLPARAVTAPAAEGVARKS